MSPTIEGVNKTFCFINAHYVPDYVAEGVLKFKAQHDRACREVHAFKCYREMTEKIN